MAPFVRSVLALMIWGAFVAWGWTVDMRRLWAPLATWVELHILIWFDPDHDLRSVDKLMHLFGGLAVCLLSLWLVTVLCTLPTAAAALVLTMIIGLVYECGQADVAHSKGLLGKPGYGIGLVDLGYDGIGALILLALRFTLRTL